MNVLLWSYESFIKSIIVQDELSGLEKLMGKFMLEEQKREVHFGSLVKMKFCRWRLEISKAEPKISKVESKILKTEQEILKVAPEISKAKSHFLDKMKKILERGDLMHSIPWTYRGTIIARKVNKFNPKSVPCHHEDAQGVATIDVN